MKKRSIIYIYLTVLVFFLSGCETTNYGTTEVTGQLREPLTEWDVDIYQDPPGLLSWVLDMEIPTKYEKIATMESSGTSGSGNPGSIEEKTTHIVTDLKKRAAKMGANGIVIRVVNVTEDVVEHRSSGYETVRYPDGSYGEVQAPVRISYQRVYKVSITADSVFLDWNTVWTGEPTTSS